MSHFILVAMEPQDTQADVVAPDRRLAIDLDEALLRHLKAEAARRGHKGVRPLLEQAIVNLIGQPDLPPAA